MSQKSIIFICFYFGRLPDWFSLYFETLKRNPTIDFLFYTDCDIREYKASNVKFVSLELKDYLNKIKNKTGIEINPDNSYKLCDFRPLLGVIHSEEILRYDYYGYADNDLLFADIRKFYDPILNSDFDVISTHKTTLSDHCILFKNVELNRLMFKKIGGWKEKISSKGVVGIGEDYLLRAYLKEIQEKKKRYKGLGSLLYCFKGPKLYLKEQYTTPFTPIPWLDGSLNSAQPDTWHYKDGKITNSRDGDREFMYIHFMNFKSSKYRHDNTPAPWEGKPRICFATPEDMKKGIKISPEGIFPA